MAIVKPFAALRPKPELADKICELPYDVMSSEEARQIAAGNPLSFLHVSKPEIDLPTSMNPYATEVYAVGRANFERLIHQGALRQDPEPCFYLYRQTLGEHSQVGIVAVASCQDYLQGIVRKHELTRPDKEDDRVRHLEALDAQTGPVFLVYRANPVLDRLVSRATGEPPEIDFTAIDGVRHTAWMLGEAEDVQVIATELSRVPTLYIADGHHRCAAAARVCQARRGAGASGFFLSVIFPHNQVRILAYNRALRDLNGMSAESLRQELERVFVIEPCDPLDRDRSPALHGRHELGFYFSGRWQKLTFRNPSTGAANPVEDLDVTLLQRQVLEPLFGIADARTSKRISFVGGIRGTDELERLVNSGQFACAFAMFPTGIEELLAVADAGSMMPPKSTWFEPKLRDGMFCHLLGGTE